MKNSRGLIVGVAILLAAATGVMANDTATTEKVVIRKQPDSVLVRQEKIRKDGKEFSKKMDDWYASKGNQAVKDERELQKRRVKNEKKTKSKDEE